jgi:hypothetical protein
MTKKKVARSSPSTSTMTVRRRRRRNPERRRLRIALQWRNQSVRISDAAMFIADN